MILTVYALFKKVIFNIYIVNRASKGLTYNESNRTIVVNSTVAEENRGENNRAQHKIDLKRDDITVFNNSKVIVGAPTEFALEIKFQSYRKRNWHICFMNVEDQMQWQKILLGCNNNEGDEAENSKGSGSLTDDSSDLVWSEAGSSSKSIDLEIVENWSDDEESDATYIPRFAMSIISFASSILSAFYRLFGFKSEKVEETIVDIVSVTQVETPIENSIQPSPKSKEKLRPGLSFPRVTLRSESSLNETIQIAGIDSATSARVLATAGVNETNQEETHCFMNTPSSCFELRVGPDYKNNKKKAPSAPALYDCHMMDFCANDNFISSVKDVFELPVVKGVTDQDTGCSHVPPIIIFNAQMPSRSTFHYSVIAYGIITEDTRRQLKDINSASPAVKLLVEYCKKAESEKKMSGRTKLIGRIEGIETTR